MDEALLGGSQRLDAEPAKPHVNTYWVIPGRLLAGEYPGDPDPAAMVGKLARFLDHGLRHFIDLTEPGELDPYADQLLGRPDARALGLGYDRFPIADYGVPEPPALMGAVLDALDAALATGRPTYVHCWGGIGRTGTVVGCFLVRRGLAGEAALARVAELYATMSPAKRQRHPHSPENQNQRDFVRAWRALDRARAGP